MKITLEVDENQARVLGQALEWLTRLNLGQINVVLHDALLRSKLYSVNFDAIERMALEIGVLLTGLPSGASWSIGNEKDPNPDARTAWDINEVLRHAIAWKRTPEGGSTTYFQEPMHWNKNQPLPKVEIKDE